MKYQDARQHLSAYLDGELGQPTRREVDAALAQSPQLRAELDALRRTAALVRALPRQDAPPGFADRVLAAIRAEAEEPAAAPHPAPGRFRRWLPAAIAAAACLLVALVTLLAPPRGGDPEHARRLGTAAPHAHEQPAAKRQASTWGRDKAQDRAEGLRASTAAAPRGPEARHVDDVAKVDTARRRKEHPGQKGDKGKAVTGGAGSARVRGSVAGRPPVLVRPGPPHPEPTGPGGAATCGLGALAPTRRDAAAAREEFERLVERIQHQRPARRPRPAPKPRTPAPAPPHGRRELLLPYRDLARSLADVQWILRRARVAHALQPEGSGRFVIEATVPEDVAADLMAQLAVAVARSTAAKDWRPAAEHGLGVATEPEEATAKGPTRSKVHLVVRFRPALPRGAAERK